ncbi:hypothetical protein [uncultured Tenacibaculum sp.]|uniref:hypothetical protein n=1 Tax=uncultured Tenacibaculum sp. TaxID=174713 RepID=UPI00260A54E0|nr:hypothetical protein [uncultured Tenacibaculum sp.]
MTEIEKIQSIIIDNSCHFEYLYSFIENVKEFYPNLKEQEIKSKVLNIIKILLSKKILRVGSAETYEYFDLPLNECIEKIDKIWFEGASHIDFLNMVFFSRTKWFYQKLEKEGYNFKDNWQEYVENNLWIKKILEINDSDLK